jgi:hypothetical protein
MSSFYNTSSGGSCSAPGGSLTVNSEDLSNNPLTGLYMQLDNSNGQQINQGYTTVTFNNLASGTYTVYANDYCASPTQYTFNHWSDGSTSRGDSVTISGSNVARTAYYSTSSC